MEEVVPICIPVGWEDYVALFASIRRLVKEDMDAGQLRLELDKTEQRIIALASPRDMNEPDAVVDETNRWGGAYRSFTDYKSFRYRILGNKIRFIEAEILGV